MPGNKHMKGIVNTVGIRLTSLDEDGKKETSKERRKL